VETGADDVQAVTVVLTDSMYACHDLQTIASSFSGLRDGVRSVCVWLSEFMEDINSGDKMSGDGQNAESARFLAAFEAHTGRV